jgi:Cu/Zn superoxide dismutase
MLARVVTFEEVDSERMAQLRQEMEGGQPPEGLEPKELLVLHDPDAEKSVAIVIFENEDDYKKGDEILGNMPTGNTPGKRTSVTKYNVATRMKS